MSLKKIFLSFAAVSTLSSYGGERRKCMKEFLRASVQNAAEQIQKSAQKGKEALEKMEQEQAEKIAKELDSYISRAFGLGNAENINVKDIETGRRIRQRQERRLRRKNRNEVWKQQVISAVNSTLERLQQSVQRAREKKIKEKHSPRRIKRRMLRALNKESWMSHFRENMKELMEHPLEEKDIQQILRRVEKKHGAAAAKRAYDEYIKMLFEKRHGGENFYEVLSVPPDADLKEIRRAYRRAARKWHPDRNTEDPLASEKMKKINQAYRTLKDPSARDQYDRVHLRKSP